MFFILRIWALKSCSIEPVVADPKEPYSIREEDLPQIMEEYDQPGQGIY